jgi:hypothetical protein
LTEDHLVLELGDTVVLVTSVTDDGAIVSCEWSVVRKGESPRFVERSKADTSFAAPSVELPDSQMYIVRITDDDGNTAVDTAIVHVTMQWQKLTELADIVSFECKRPSQTVYNGSIYHFEYNQVSASQDGEYWSKTTIPHPFPAHEMSSIVGFKGKLWIIGGYNSLSCEVFNDIWSSEDGLAWAQVVDSAEFPPRHSLCVLELKDTLWLLGGNGGQGFLRDVWKSSDGRAWELVTETAGFGRHAIRATVFNEEIWVFPPNGGIALHTPDGKNWAQETVAAEMAPSNCAVAGGKVWAITKSLVGNIWSSRDGKSWDKVSTLPLLAERDNVGFVSKGNDIYVMFGDQGSMDCFRDVWISSLK